MHDPQDRLELHTPPSPSAATPPAAGSSGPDAAGPRRRFLSVWFTCCHAYGRLTIDEAGTRYQGRCPRCGRRAGASVGAGGTTRRLFEAR